MYTHTHMHKSHLALGGHTIERQHCELGVGASLSEVTLLETPSLTPLHTHLPGILAPQECGKGVWCKGAEAENKYMAKMEAPSMIPAWLLFSQL